MMMFIHILHVRSVFAGIFLLALVGCGSPGSTTTNASSAGADRSGIGSGAASGRAGSSTLIDLESAEGRIDTIDFHIGSPLFLRFRMPEGSACAPFNGQPFFFDATGAQLGWGFAEVVDSLLFPRDSHPCDRILMLSSEHSNRLAEGYFSLKIQIYNDERSRINSDTILLHPFRSSSGATAQSYSRFIQEQIIRNGQLLINDAETRAALFGEGVPESPESEIYHAVILYRSGDIAGAESALKHSREMERVRSRPLGEDARIARDALAARLGGAASAR